MSVTAIVDNGKVILPEGVTWPSGTLVHVEPLPPEAQAPTLAEALKDFIGVFEDLPADLAQNHDHYLHGQAKE